MLTKEFLIRCQECGVYYPPRVIYNVQKKRIEAGKISNVFCRDCRQKFYWRQRKRGTELPNGKVVRTWYKVYSVKNIPSVIKMGIP